MGYKKVKVKDKPKTRITEVDFGQYGKSLKICLDESIVIVHVLKTAS